MRQRRFCLSSCSSLPHHGLPGSHTWPRTLTTPLHATTLHSHLLPAHTPAPRSHLCFGYKQPVPGALLGFASVAAKDRATLHIPHTPWQSIQKYTQWVCSGETYDWRAAAPTLLVFVLAAICSMLQQDLIPGLTPTQHNTLARNNTSLPPPSVLPPLHTHTFQHTIFLQNY